MGVAGCPAIEVRLHSSIKVQQKANIMAKELKDILHHLLGQNHDSWQVQLLTRWDAIVGNLKTQVHLLRIHEDTLILGVPDVCWMQELYLLTPLLLQTINQNLDKPRIKNLRFKAAGKPCDKKHTGKKSSFTPKKMIVKLSISEEKALNELADPELAAAFKEYLARCRE